MYVESNELTRYLFLQQARMEWFDLNPVISDKPQNLSRWKVQEKKEKYETKEHERKIQMKRIRYERCRFLFSFTGNYGLD